MKRSTSLLCTSVLTLAMASTAFGGNISTRSGNISTAPGNISTAPGNISTAPGNISTAPGNISTLSDSIYAAILALLIP